MAEENPATTNYVTSADGTRIAYLTTQGSQGHAGAGAPGIVLIQGAMADVHAFRDLSSSLASASSPFTVHSLERRGRGLSPLPYSKSQHSLSRDVEDVIAVLSATGARHVFGLSSGALITLEVARVVAAAAGGGGGGGPGRQPLLDSIAVFEPPFYGVGSTQGGGGGDHHHPPLSRDGIARLHANIEAGKLAAALMDALDTAGTAPPAIRSLPKPVGRIMAKAVLAMDGAANKKKKQKKQKGDNDDDENDQKKSGEQSSQKSTSLKELIPGVRFDFHDVEEVDGRGGIGSFRGNISVPVLVLSGSESPAFLREAARELSKVLSEGAGARHVELEELGHDGPWNNGEPVVVARELRRFFGRR